MKYIRIFLGTVIVAYIVHFAAIFLLIDAPIRADYWVGEMLTVKKSLVRKYAGQRKIIVAGGSSALFGIDTEEASRQFEMPVINFGVFAGLRLGKVLAEVGYVVERGDFLILVLEPPYYDCNEKLTDWQVKNIIAWDHDSWQGMTALQKVEFIPLVSRDTWNSMISAGIKREFFPDKIRDRMMALDKTLVESAFQSRAVPESFKYSAYHLNNHGDMQRTEGAYFKGEGFDVSKPQHVCAETARQLDNFVRQMKQNGVHVYFSNTPYIASGISVAKIENDEIHFKSEFIAGGCFMDKRVDKVFDRKYFFDTSLHLNAEGRAINTGLFINAVRKSVFSGVCQ